MGESPQFNGSQSAIWETPDLRLMSEVEGGREGQFCGSERLTHGVGTNSRWRTLEFNSVVIGHPATGDLENWLLVCETPTFPLRCTFLVSERFCGQKQILVFPTSLCTLESSEGKRPWNQGLGAMLRRPVTRSPALTPDSWAFGLFQMSAKECPNPLKNFHKGLSEP